MSSPSTDEQTEGEVTRRLKMRKRMKRSRRRRRRRRSRRSRRRGGLRRDGGPRRSVEDEEGGGGGSRELRITTLNVCALRNHLDEILDEVEADCIFVQESGLTRHNTEAVRAALARHDVDLTTGPMMEVGTRFNRKHNKAFREGAGSAKGGVAILHRVPISQLEFDQEEMMGTKEEVEEDLEELEAAMRFLRSTRRFQAASIPIKGTTINVMNVYGYSGANSKAEEMAFNERFLEAVALVAAGLGDVPTVIVGDFNVGMQKSRVLQQLVEEGWSNAAEMYGMEEECTYFATEEDWENGNGTVIDHVLLNPAATTMVDKVTLGERRRKGGHREVNVTFKNVLEDRVGPTFKAPRRARMEKEDMKSKKQIAEETAVIIADGHREVEDLLQRDCMDEAWSRLIQTADEAICEARKGCESEEEEKARRLEEERCRHRWPMKFQLKRALAPVATTMGLASASDAMVGRRRNQIRRIEEAMVKEKIARDPTVSEEVRRKKREELESLMETMRGCAEERSAFTRPGRNGPRGRRRR